MTIKETGVVRRIDDLGRIVIPKEYRRIMNISDGDPFELLIIDNDTVGFRKYQDLTTLKSAKNAAFTLKHLFVSDKFKVYDRSYFNSAFTKFYDGTRTESDIPKAMDDYNMNKGSGALIGCYHRTIVMPLYNEEGPTCFVRAETADDDVDHLNELCRTMSIIASFIKYEGR